MLKSVCGARVAYLRVSTREDRFVRPTTAYL